MHVRNHLIDLIELMCIRNYSKSNISCAWVFWGVKLLKQFTYHSGDALIPKQSLSWFNNQPAIL